MKETNYDYTRTKTGADYLNDGPPRAEFTPDGETAFSKNAAASARAGNLRLRQ